MTFAEFQQTKIATNSMGPHLGSHLDGVEGFVYMGDYNIRQINEAIPGHKYKMYFGDDEHSSDNLEEIEKILYDNLCGEGELQRTNVVNPTRFVTLNATAEGIEPNFDLEDLLEEDDDD